MLVIHNVEVLLPLLLNVLVKSVVTYWDKTP